MKHLNKDGSLDRRFKENQTLEVREWLFWQKYGHLVVAGLLGLIAGSVLTVSLWRAKNTPVTSPEAPQQNLDVGTVKGVGKSLVDVVEASETPYCYDPITCIRDVGEELGVPNQDILTMIRIARAESSLNPLAKNRNSTASGLFQVIASTWYHYDCVGDKWDFEDNIRCAYKLYQKSGFQPWNASKAVWNR